MASTLVDLVKINVTSTGTGPLTLGTPATGYRGREALVNGGVYSYSIQQSNNWEYGRGTYLSATKQLVRSVINSSTGGTAIVLQGGAQVALTALASDFASSSEMASAITAAANAATAATAATNAANTATASAANAQTAADAASATLVGAAKSADLASTATGKGAALMGYIAPGTGATAKTANDVLNSNVRADDYSTVQAAADYASSLTSGTASVRSRVEFGASNYSATSTLTHYEGQVWQGHGNAESLNRINSRITVATDNIDGIRMSGHAVGSEQWNYGEWSNFMIIGKGATSTSGWGLNWYDGSVDLRPQGQTTVRRVTVRNFASGGIRMANGGLETRLSDLKFMDHGGPGLYYKGVTNSQQSVVFEGLAADHCISGGLYLDTLPSNGHITVRDFKSEAGVNKQFGANFTFTGSCVGTALTTVGGPSLAAGHEVVTASGTSLGVITSGSGDSWVVSVGGTYASQTFTAYTAIAQSNAVIVNNPVANAGLVIDGLTHICSGTYINKPGDAILINGTNTPDLEWRNVRVRTLGTQTLGSAPNILSAPTLGVTISTAYPSGILSNMSRIHRTTIDGVYRVFGKADDYKAKFNEGPAEQIAGAIPGRSLYVTGGAADEKQWLDSATGTNLTRRVVSDDGVTTAIYEQVTRSGATVTGEQHRRVLNSLGTTHVAGDWSLASGWGNTASVAIVGGSKDNRFSISVTCNGTGIAANPAATLTFKDGAFPATPVGVVMGWNSTDNAGVSFSVAFTTTTCTVTFLGTPVAGKVYRINGVLN
jgi:hypothetical protein